MRRVRRGVYCTDPERGATFVEAVVAALLVLPAGSLACGLTAARLWRLDALVPVQPDEPLEFLVPGRAGSVSLDGCLLHFGAFTSVGLPAGIPATSRARTIIDLLPQLSFGDGVALVEAALRGDPEVADELHTERRRRLPRRGGSHAATVLDFASWRSESVLESHARALWATAGLPVPIQQAEVRLEGAFVGRVDFLWPQQLVIVEVDGLAKYSEPGELQREKVRQNRLVAAGYIVLRFTWRDITRRPDDVVAQVRRALARGVSR